jgi:hypothetical protein
LRHLSNISLCNICTESFTLLNSFKYFRMKGTNSFEILLPNEIRRTNYSSLGQVPTVPQTEKYCSLEHSVLKETILEDSQLSYSPLCFGIRKENFQQKNSSFFVSNARTIHRFDTSRNFLKFKQYFLELKFFLSMKLPLKCLSTLEILDEIMQSTIRPQELVVDLNRSVLLSSLLMPQ